VIVQGEKQTVKRFRGKGIKNGSCTKNLHKDANISQSVAFF